MTSVLEGAVGDDGVHWDVAPDHDLGTAFVLGPLHLSMLLELPQRVLGSYLLVLFLEARVREVYDGDLRINHVTVNDVSFLIQLDKTFEDLHCVVHGLD